MAHPPAPTPFYSLLGKAQWSTDTINRLPDDAFLVIEPGGRKDETGRIAPRSLRHLPVYDADGNLDLPHLVNAIAQIPKAGPWLAGPARERLLDKARAMLERAHETTHKAARGVPLWAVGYLRNLDAHQALGIGREIADKAWGDVQLGKRIAGWAKSFKANGGTTGQIPNPVEAALRAKVAAHNGRAAAPHAKAKLGVLKEVWKRGAAAFGTAGRPAVLNRVQWAMERVNAFLHLLGHSAPRLGAYAADNDLLPPEHPRSPAHKGAAPAPPGADVTETGKDELGDEDLDAGESPKRSFRGIPIVIDRPKGFVQELTLGDGRTIERTYLVDYGYIPSTLGGDGDELDVFLGPDPEAPLAFWAVQITADGSFDEYKLFLGYGSEEEARACYIAHIPEVFLGRMFTTSVEMVRAMLGLEPEELLQASAPPRTYFRRSARGELTMAHPPQPVVFSPSQASEGASSVPAPAEPMEMSAADHEAMAKAVRAVASVIPPGKALRSSALGEGWREKLSKEGAEVLLLSPMDPLGVDLGQLVEALGSTTRAYLVEYPDTSAARAALGGRGESFVLDDAPGRLFVANYDLPLIKGLRVIRGDGSAAGAGEGAPGGEAEPAVNGGADPESEKGAAEVEKAEPLCFVSIGKDAQGAPAEERYVLGPVLIPGRPDTQGDVYSEAEVRMTAHDWMAHYQNMGVQHAVRPEKIDGFRMDIEGLANARIVPLETWLLLKDDEINGRPLPKGTWMLAARYVDDELWAKVKTGQITGWSIGGLATRTPMAA